jgi:hypothetical protein
MMVSSAAETQFPATWPMARAQGPNPRTASTTVVMTLIGTAVNSMIAMRFWEKLRTSSPWGTATKPSMTTVRAIRRRMPTDRGLSMNSANAGANAKHTT